MERVFDDLIISNICLFLNPFELMCLETTSCFWKNSVYICWKLVTKMPYLLWHTYKERVDLTQKSLCARVWRTKIKKQGTVHIVGGTQLNPTKESSVIFYDNTNVLEYYVNCDTLNSLPSKLTSTAVTINVV
jgi:hypothetical protein